MKSFIAPLIQSQKYLSAKFDRILPAYLTNSANQFFDKEIVPQYLSDGMTIYDIGGGKLPNIRREQKEQYNLKLIGVDIDQAELDKAPEGIYDEKIATDITQYQGRGDGDLIICRALMEHVENIEDSFQNMQSILKQGGHILIFVPCKNALFARLNMILPDNFKRKLLQFLFPVRSQKLGFTAYYDRCTPDQMSKVLSNLGYEVVIAKPFFNSHYFSIFTPVHILWRLYQLIIYAFKQKNLCEAFVVVAKK